MSSVLFLHSLAIIEYITLFTFTITITMITYIHTYIHTYIIVGEVTYQLLFSLFVSYKYIYISYDIIPLI